MPEVLIRLERPASLTPELRAWIRQRLGSGRALLTRRRLNGSDPGALLLRVEVAPDARAGVQEEVADLMTDLRLLGLRPTLVSEPVIWAGRGYEPAARTT
ncbi:MAG: hypothetical protein JO321_09240 [Solirubrobacterales bacterium]|nr:hypothetical protein [Solirubrobacterales bacterium]MBV9167499.1 hypothetical protein [Solirubrobacterales bacterium]MBV9535581.1 hypothetical protein [Solirubrobacterales bacterium]